MKNNKINKILSSVVAMILMITMLPNVHVFADDEGICGDGVTYSFDQSTGTLTIRGNGKMKDYQHEFVSIGGSVYIEYALWYEYRDDIKKVIIENGVTSIGDSAFRDCKNLISVTIPDSVTSIGWHAFEGCSGLKSITIPGSVTEIGNYAFSGCTGLTSIIIPASVTSIGECAFEGCTNLTVR